MGERIAKATPVPLEGPSTARVAASSHSPAKETAARYDPSLMLNETRVALLLLSALSAAVAPACGRAYRPDGGLFSGTPGLLHPDVPGDRPDFLIVEGMTGQFQRQLDLPVMVALVPHHVLHQQERM